MLYIYVEEISNRLIYTLDFVFQGVGVNYQLTNDHVLFQKKEDVVKLNYSYQHFEGVFQLLPSNLLFQEKVCYQEVKHVQYFREKCFSFSEIVDPLASVFFVLSRMEEYYDQRRDQHNRFAAKYSLQYQYGILQQCVADRWSRDLIAAVEEFYSTHLGAHISTVQIIPTFDIDNSFAFLNYPLWRRVVGRVKDLLQRDNYRRSYRNDVVAKKRKDPYDTFQYIVNLSKRGFRPRVFWQVGDFGKYDKNCSVYNQKHQKVIAAVAEFVEVGIHPSYKSNSSLHVLEKEQLRLEQVLGRKISSSRQHYLKFLFPHTFQIMQKFGIKEDYSLGYADEVGFRAGTARPFHFFDLQKNEQSELILHPFAYMDGTLNEYKKWSIVESKQEIFKLYKEIKSFGGDLICIWHNSTIGDYGIWKDWIHVLEFTLGFHLDKPQDRSYE